MSSDQEHPGEGCYLNGVVETLTSLGELEEAPRKNSPLKLREWGFRNIPHDGPQGGY